MDIKIAKICQSISTKNYDKIAKISVIGSSFFHFLGLTVTNGKNVAMFIQIKKHWERLIHNLQ